MPRKKPIIGIVGRPDMLNDGDAIICVWEKTRRAIVQKGVIPVLVLPTQNIIYEEIRPKDTPRLIETEKEDLKTIVDCCDGLWIPGGYKWYEYDLVIYQYALKKDIPILGVCAGMQMMASMDNQKRDESIRGNAKNDTKINHHQENQKYVHNVTITNNTLLKKIVDTDEMQVNSEHNYHVQTTTEFIISAYSEDGLIEAIELPNKKFVVGTQWHLETMLNYDEYANKIVDAFIESCRN